MSRMYVGIYLSIYTIDRGLWRATKPPRTKLYQALNQDLGPPPSALFRAALPTHDILTE